MNASHRSDTAKPVGDPKPETAETERRWDLHAQHKSRIWEDIQSSTDSFDQSLLTLSSGALGLSLAFIKDIVPLADAVWISLIFASWIAFALCILTTVTSFLLSVKANRQQLGYIDQYYIHRKDDALDKQSSSGYVKWLDGCTLAGIVLFIVGLFCTIMFACKNVARYQMSEKGKSPIKIEAVQGGRQPVDMTPVTPASPAPSETRPATPMTPTKGTGLDKGRKTLPVIPVKPAKAPPAQKEAQKE